MITVYVYIGEGRYFHGVPARNLSEEEWAALSPDIRLAGLQRGLYRAQAMPQVAPSLADETAQEVAEALAAFDHKTEGEE